MSKVVSKCGEFSGKGGKVPIYGMDALSLQKVSEWKVLGMGILSTTVAMWQGDTPVTWPFDFTLTAGVGEIKDRQLLYEKIKLFHSWAAHTGDGSQIKHPPLVNLIIPGYISCKGSVTRITATAKPPWDIKGKIYPTFCQFTGEFLLLPGYKPAGGGIDIVAQLTKFSSDSVAGNFYSS